MPVVCRAMQWSVALSILAPGLLQAQNPVCGFEPGEFPNPGSHPIGGYHPRLPNDWRQTEQCGYDCRALIPIAGNVSKPSIDRIFEEWQ